MSETSDAGGVESPSDVDLQRPWLGLRSFTEDLQAYFYGRRDESDELLRRVKRKRLTVLFGQSGLGKTSLLQAGLFPRLRPQGFLPVLVRIDYSAAAPAPSQQVKTAVKQAVEAAGLVRPQAPQDAPAAPPGTDEMTLWEFFHRLDFGLQAADGSPLNVVLVFDQFEELFTLGRADEQSRGRSAPFLTELAELIEKRVPESLQQRFGEDPDLVEQFFMEREDYRVLLSLREDYLPNLEGLRQRIPSIAENRMRLTRMTGRQAFEAVTQPGADLVLPSVSRQIVRFVAGVPILSTNGDSTAEDYDLDDLEVEPALLSLFCRELNNRRLAIGLPEITNDLLADSREDILRDFYERCLADQQPQVRAFVEEELLTESGYRENMVLEQAQKKLAQQGAPATALDALVKRRLLHVEERLKVQRVELTHDVLTEIVKKSRDQRLQREQAERAERRERQLHRRVLVVGATALLIGFITASIIYWYLDAQVWERVSYYNLVTKKYGVPVGVGELTAANVAARRTSFRFTRRGRGGPVLKMEAVNGYGELTPEHEVGTYLREAFESRSSKVHGDCHWEFVYDNEGRIVYEKAFDKFGNMVWGFVYSPMSDARRARGHYVGPDGYPQAQRKSAAEYVEIEYSPEGWERIRRYYDRSGKRQPGPNRAFGELREYNERGLITKKMSLDADDQFTIDVAGNSGLVVLRHDKLGNELEAVSLGPDERPMSVSGWTKVIHEFDDHGNQIGQRYFDVQGRPTRHKDGNAGWTAKFDERGNQIEFRCFDEAGRPALHREGYAGANWQYDERGNPTQVVCFGLDGKPLALPDGYASVTSEFDERGNETTIRFFDESGQPTLHKDLIAGWTSTYDERGNETERRFFDEQGQPTRHQDGNAGWASTFDARGNQIEVRYFDEAGRPTLHVDGEAGWNATYDERGNQTSVVYLGLDGKPKQQPQGHASMTLVYDERGNETQRRFFDEAGQPTRHESGYAGWTSKFDARGQEIEVRYFDEAGQPTLHVDGEAGWNATYDQRGNQTRLVYVGLDGNPKRQPQGYASTTSEFDERGNAVAVRFFDESGSPTRNSDGYASRSSAYDECGNEIERRHFDEQGQPLNLPDGESGWQREYDHAGRVIRQVYLDILGNPYRKATTKVMVTHSEYDHHGNETRRAFYDERGNPQANHQGVAAMVARYDKRGHEVERHYYDAAGAPVGLGNTSEAAWIAKYEGNRKVEHALLDVHGETFERLVYDAAGRLIEQWYREATGDGYNRVTAEYAAAGHEQQRTYFYETKPHTQGYHREVWTFDESGKRLRESYLDKNGKPFPIGDGFTRIDYQYDSAGNETGRIYLYEDQPHADGYVMRRVTQQDTEETEVYLDAGGRPTRHRHGYFGVTTRKETSLGMAVERRRYFSIAALGELAAPVVVRTTRDGQRVALQETVQRATAADGRFPYAFQQEAIDFNGRVTEVSYHALDEQLAPHPNGYARLVVEYDPQGRVQGHVYYDAAGGQLEMEAFITRIAGDSPAEQLGLMPGDVLLSYDGQPVVDYASFLYRQQRQEPDAGPGKLVVRRGPQEIVVEVAAGVLGMDLEDRARQGPSN